MGDEQAVVAARRRPLVGIRSILLILVVGGGAALCYLNRSPVAVRPFGHAPLYHLLLGASAIGLAVGWSLSARFTGWRMRRSRPTPDKAPSTSPKTQA